MSSSSFYIRANSRVVCICSYFICFDKQLDLWVALLEEISNFGSNRAKVWCLYCDLGRGI